MTECVVDRRDRSHKPPGEPAQVVETALACPTSPSKSDLLLDAAERAARYAAAERERPVVPSAEAVDRLGSFEFNAILDRPLDADDVIAMLDEVGGAATVTNTGGRYFGFVTGGVEPVGLAASVLAGAWDQNAALPVMSPVAAHLDALAADWIVDLLGLPTDTVATFCAGASIANLTAIITARDTLLRRVGWDTATDGLIGAPPIDIVRRRRSTRRCSKALRLAGLGTGSVHQMRDRRVRAGPSPRRFPSAVLDRLDRRSSCSRRATSTRATATPSRPIIGRFDRETTWVHVDGAFGLWANAAPHRRHLLDGVESAPTHGRPTATSGSTRRTTAAW